MLLLPCFVCGGVLRHSSIGETCMLGICMLLVDVEVEAWLKNNDIAWSLYLLNDSTASGIDGSLTSSRPPTFTQCGAAMTI
jgi:hypothetical protein